MRNCAGEVEDFGCGAGERERTGGAHEGRRRVELESRRFEAVKMADDKEIRRWVGDQLINLLGYNNPTTVSFVIGLGTEHRFLLSLGVIYSNPEF